MAALGEMADSDGGEPVRAYLITRPTAMLRPAMLRTVTPPSFVFRLLSFFVLAMMLANAVACAGVLARGDAGVASPGSAARQTTSFLSDGADTVHKVTAAPADWVRAAPARMMALLLGVSAMLALLPLALLVRGIRLAATSRRLRQSVAERAEVGSRTAEVTGFSRPRRAFLEVPAPADVEPFEIRGELVRIGQAADNEVVVASSGVEPYHAAIARTADWDLYLCDLTHGSRTAARVNGRRVGRHRLSDGDVIVLGSVCLTYRTASL